MIQSQRSPEVQEAIKKFEVLSGHKVIKAKRYTGSMKGYVHFEVQANYNDFDYQLGQVKIAFKQNLDYLRQYMTTVGLDVEWSALGMSNNNAYLNKFRHV